MKKPVTYVTGFLFCHSRVDTICYRHYLEVGHRANLGNRQYQR